LEQGKKIKMEWFLRFLNMDLEKASSQEKMRLIMESQAAWDNYLITVLNLEGLTIDEARSSPELQKLHHMQAGLRSLIDGMRARFAELQLYQEKGKALSSPAEKVGPWSLAEIETTIEAKVVLPGKPKVVRMNDNGEKLRAYWPIGDSLHTPVLIEITPAPTEKGFLFLFLRTLEGIPFSHIKECSVCKRLFLQSGERKRLFCSDQCRARKHSIEKSKKKDEEKKTRQYPQVDAKGKRLRFLRIPVESSIQSAKDDDQGE
jgi:hypothetical protein